MTKISAAESPVLEIGRILKNKLGFLMVKNINNSYCGCGHCEYIHMYFLPLNCRAATYTVFYPFGYFLIILVFECFFSILIFTYYMYLHMCTHIQCSSIVGHSVLIMILVIIGGACINFICKRT